MHIVDRRLNPRGKSLENRQRFLRRMLSYHIDTTPSGSTTSKDARYLIDDRATGSGEYGVLTSAYFATELGASQDYVLMQSKNGTTTGQVVISLSASTTKGQVGEMISVVDAALSQLTTVGSAFGALEKRINLQNDFATKLHDNNATGIGRLVDADMLPSPGKTMDVTDITSFLSLRAFERERRRVERLQAVVLEKQRLRREVALYRFNDAERIKAAEIEKQRQAEEERLRALAQKAAAEKAAAEAEAAHAAEAKAKADADAQARAAAEAEAARRSGQAQPGPLNFDQLPGVQAQ